LKGKPILLKFQLNRRVGARKNRALRMQSAVLSVLLFTD
jgi:hypothetical protein